MRAENRQLVRQLVQTEPLRIGAERRGSMRNDMFVHPVYMGFCLFVFQDRRSGDVSSMPWRVRGTFVFRVINSIGTWSYPPPRRPSSTPT